MSRRVTVAATATTSKRSAVIAEQNDVAPEPADIHDHCPGDFGAAPGASDKILGDKMAGAVVVVKTPGPSGILSTTTVGYP